MDVAAERKAIGWRHRPRSSRAGRISHRLFIAAFWACCIPGLLLGLSIHGLMPAHGQPPTTAPTMDAVMNWDLGEPDASRGKSAGRLRPGSGPRSPEFPAFTATNQSLRFDGRGSRLTFAPGKDEDDLRFGLGDELTLQAWISPRRDKGGSHRYIIGKGRTGTKGFRKDNQNWAMRLTPKGDGYRLSFLFASADGPKSVRWHRWTTNATVTADDGWHLVALTYRFGEPDTIGGWIDGKPCEGEWDMAGSTTAAPIEDEDEVWIGSSMSGSAGNSFIGSIDRVSVSRRLADDAKMEASFQRDESIPRESRREKPVVPTTPLITPGVVQFELLEDLPYQDQWPDQEDLAQLPPPRHPGATWQGESFLFARLPVRFDDWGIRAAWQAPVLLRASARVDLPTGKSTFLLRARSLSRLWIDGKLVGQTKPQDTKAPSGEEPITPLADPPSPGMRVKGYRQQEVLVEHSIEGQGATRRCDVILELIAGGKGIRTETGEVCVAFKPDSDDHYQVLVPIESNGPLSLAEDSASRALRQSETDMLKSEIRTRRQLARGEDAFWQRRHELARRWAKANPPPPIPSSHDPSAHPVDAFLEHRIEQAKAEQETATADPVTNHQADRFHQDVFPILQKHCLRCHGRASKGGLRLDSRASSLAGGESGWAAVVPGAPDESELVLRLQSDDPSTLMPLGGESLTTAEIEQLSGWIERGAEWPDPELDPESLEPTETISDAEFIRRVALDTIGLPPSEEEVLRFLSDSSANKRERLIDRFLDDDRVADHLISDWLDLLGENPSLLNTSLNSTGPFRFFLHDALVDRKPIDRMVSELIMLRGDRHTGGSAGFGMAGENDAPLAAKAHILASGLLGVELQCARCHDAPFHSTTQKDLFAFAAMLNRKPLTVPETSRVPIAFFEEQQREPLIEVTLEAGKPVSPNWPLARFTGVDDDASLKPLMHNPDDTRDRLAALLTAPGNERFPAVIVNRTWKRLIGAGLVTSVSDWEHHRPSHPELLKYLSHRFVAEGYDIRKLMRWIMNSKVYGRRAIDPKGDATIHFFAAPLPRRLTAEQIVDSLFASTGRSMDCEELTFVHDGRRPLSNRLTLGTPTRAWMMATLNNERDRPSLSLPKARAIADVLQAFGWTGSRQKPIHQRDSEPNVLQPGVLANGMLSASLSKAVAESPLADLAVQADSPDSIVESLFLRFLSRPPNSDERRFFTGQLDEGFESRVIPTAERSQISPPSPLPLVHWFNHLRPRANEIQAELERRVRQGSPRDPRLNDDWTQRYEDVVWSLINHDEFVWVP